MDRFGAGTGTREAKRTLLQRKSHPFWSPFWQLSNIVEGVFFSVFSGALISRTLGVLGAQRWPKGRFWVVMLMPLGGQGEHVRIDVLCRRQLNSEGSGGSRNG